MLNGQTDKVSDTRRDTVPDMVSDTRRDMVSDAVSDTRRDTVPDTEKVRIAVLVSGGGTNLEALLQAQERGEIPHGQIVLTVSNVPDAYALTRAKNHGVPAVTVPSRGRPRETFEQELTQCLRDARAEVILLAGFLAILSAEFVREWPDRILNVHPSLIPSFCGMGFYGLKVHEAALARGVKVTGATVHLVNEIPDGGQIVLQKAVEILPGDTPEILQRRVMERAEWILLPKAAEWLCSRMISGDDAEETDVRDEESHG